MRKWAHWPAEKKAAVAKMWRAGRSRIEIAAAMGVPVRTIDYQLRAMREKGEGLDKRWGPPAVTGDAKAWPQPVTSSLMVGATLRRVHYDSVAAYLAGRARRSEILPAPQPRPQPRLAARRLISIAASDGRQVTALSPWRDVIPPAEDGRPFEGGRDVACFTSFAALCAEAAI